MILLFSTRICQQAKEPTHFYLCVLSTFLYLHECMHTYTIILSHRVEENESFFFSHEQGQIRQEQKHSHTHTHTHTDTQTHRHTDTQTHRHTHTYIKT